MLVQRVGVSGTFHDVRLYGFFPPSGNILDFPPQISRTIPAGQADQVQSAHTDANDVSRDAAAIDRGRGPTDSFGKVALVAIPTIMLFLRYK
jgi:hypothetical protein